MQVSVTVSEIEKIPEAWWDAITFAGQLYRCVPVLTGRDPADEKQGFDGLSIRLPRRKRCDPETGTLLR